MEPVMQENKKLIHGTKKNWQILRSAPGPTMFIISSSLKRHMYQHCFQVDFLGILMLND